MKSRIIGAILIVSALGIFSALWYLNSPKQHIPIVFSPHNMLTSLWKSYKQNYIEEGTWRTIDKGAGNITTSEGQSYTMLRAVWMSDKVTFDRSWKWTKDNLKFEDAFIFSWLFGERPDGSYGILTDRGGQNAASDSDTDIALALVFAYFRWNDDTYLNEARAVIHDIWEHEVMMINDRPYLAANNIEKYSSDPGIVVNPSYFSPYAYKIFAKIDPDHDWLGVADTSYEVLAASTGSSLDTIRTAYLPPDWVRIDKRTGAISAHTASSLTTNYGFDALRTPWRIALDWEWFEDPRARQALARFDFLRREWQSDQIIYATYAHDGSVVSNFESPAMYGASLGYFKIFDGIGEEIYNQKLASLYNPDVREWKQPLGYYNENWAWFGIALWHNMLPNLASELFN